MSAKDHARLGAALGNDLAPRIDHQRVAERVAAVLVPAALGRGEHEAAVLDGRARISTCQWASPVCLVKAEGIARNEAPASAQRAIERREAQIVANRQGEPAPRQVGDHGKVAGTVGVGFAIALAAGEVDVEHVDLVVARGDVAVAVDQERAVRRLLRSSLDRKRAEMFDYQAGDVGYVPRAMPHYVENRGTTPMRFLEMFRSR